MVPLVKFSVEEVAEHFGVSKRYLSETAKAKKLCGKAGRSLYFTESDIEALDELWHGSGSTKGARSGGLTVKSLAGASEKARARLIKDTPKLTQRGGRRRNGGGQSSVTKPSSRSAQLPASTSTPENQSAT